MLEVLVDVAIVEVRPAAGGEGQETGHVLVGDGLLDPNVGIVVCQCGYNSWGTLAIDMHSKIRRTKHTIQ